MPESIIKYSGQPAKIKCDGKCNKAWGINSRPKVQLSEDEDDVVYLSDSELGDAPDNPGTYEGWSAKPLNTSEFTGNRWCARECERLSISKPGEHDLPLELKDWNSRVFNMPHESR